MLSDRQSFYLDNEGEYDVARAAEEFLLQYYASAMSIPALIVVQGELAEGSELGVLAEMLAERRGGPVEIRAAERGGKRRILDLAERNARLALDQEKLRSERRRQQRVEALDALQKALAARRAAGAHRVLRHLQHRRHAHGRLDGRVRGRRAEEVRLPPLHHPHRRRQRRFRLDGRGPRAAATRSGRSRPRSSPYDAERDASFAALPNLVVIDGGPGQLSAGLEPLRGLPSTAASRSSRSPSGSRRSSSPAAPSRCGSPTTRPSCSCSSACATRPTASPSRTTGSRRDKAMTESVMDELPGIGPARKRALLKHFGSPEAVLAAPRDALEAVPGVPQKVARELYAHLNRTGR